MKKTDIKIHILKYLADNKWQFLSVCGVLLIGILSGTLFAVYIKAESAELMTRYINNFVSAYNLQTTDLYSVFKSALYFNIKTVLFIWLASLWIGFLPFSVLQVGIMGHKLGFLAAFIPKTFGLKGVFFVIASLIPQCLISIPFVIFYSVFNTNFSILRHKTKNRTISRKIKTDIYIKNLIYLLIAIAVSFVVALMDAYIVPWVLKIVCSFWGN